MVDRETVVKSLELCQSSKDCLGEKCPYFRYDLKKFCRDQLLDDALAVLKEIQPPRMMTWEEVMKTDGQEYVWAEIRTPRFGMAGNLARLYCTVKKVKDYPTSYLLMDEVGTDLIRDEEDYNVNVHEGIHSGWRCWTARPSDEERKAVPWE